MSTSPTKALRAAVIARLVADNGVKATAMGATPAIYNRVPPKTAFPFLAVRCEQINDDTHSERGALIDLFVNVEGEYEGDQQGEDIFAAVKDCLRAWALPATLSGNVLSNLIFITEAVASSEDGKRYAGLQLWQARTEET